MTDLIPFDYQGGHQIRVVMIEGEPWFVLADLARILGYRDAANAARLLRSSELRTHSMSTNAGQRGVTICNEPGLYRLIMRSNRPEAEPFQDWVTGEVLPSIRKTGGYTVPRQRPELSRMDLIEIARAAEVERLALAEQVSELEPAAQAWDHLASEAAGDYSLREAAQILSRDPNITTGQNRLMTQLRSLGWVDRHGQPYQRHVDTGRLARRVSSYDHPHTGEAKLSTQTRVTAKGLRELHGLLGGSQPLQVSAAVVVG